MISNLKLHSVYMALYNFCSKVGKGTKGIGFDLRLVFCTITIPFLSSLLIMAKAAR